MNSNPSESIKVAVRVRPLISREINENETIKWEWNENELRSLEDNGRLECFTFDFVLGMESRNSQLYDIIKPIVYDATNGINGTIFAYGQTSSGKTHSIMGDKEEPGIIPLAISDIFSHIERNTSNRKYLIRACYMQIYNEKISDLLDPASKDLKIREDISGSVSVKVKEEITRTKEELMEVVHQGNKNRQIGETQMNQQSSRSHVILQIIIESSEEIEEDTPVQVSSLFLVDLAGSERVAQTKATGMRLKEGGHINKSLSVLSLVMNQLSQKKEHISFRDSKLTRILSNALGGNAKTLIIATITPVAYENTLSTLQFAKCAKTIINKPLINKILTEAAMIKQYQQKEKELLKQLQSEKEKNIYLQKDRTTKDKKINYLEMMLKNIRKDFVFNKTPKVSKIPRRHTSAFEIHTKPSEASSSTLMRKPSLLNNIKEEKWIKEEEEEKEEKEEIKTPPPSSFITPKTTKFVSFATTNEETPVTVWKERFKHLSESIERTNNFKSDELTCALNYQSELESKLEEVMVELESSKKDKQKAEDLMRDYQRKFEERDVICSEAELQLNFIQNKYKKREHELLTKLEEQAQELEKYKNLENQMYAMKREHEYMEEMKKTVVDFKQQLEILERESIEIKKERDWLSDELREVQRVEVARKRTFRERIKLLLLNNVASEELKNIEINLPDIKQGLSITGSMHESISGSATANMKHDVDFELHVEKLEEIEEDLKYFDVIAAECERLKKKLEEMDALKEEIKQKDTKVDLMKSQLEDQEKLIKEKEVAATSTNLLSNANSEMQSTLACLKLQLEEHKRVLAEKDDKLQCLVKMASRDEESNSKIESLESTLRDLNVKLEKQRLEIESKSTEIESLCNTIQETSTQKELLESRLLDLNSELEKERKMIESKNTEIESLCNTIQETNSHKETLESTLLDLKTELQKEIESKNSEIGSLSNTINEINVQKESLESTLLDLRNELEEERKMCQSKKTEIESLSNSIKEINAHRNSLESALLDLKTELEKETRTKNGEIESLHVIINEKNTQKESLELTLLDLRTELEKQKSVVESKNCEIEALSKTIKDLNAQNESLETNFAQLSTSTKESDFKIKSLESNLLDLKTELEKERADAQSKNTEIEVLSNSIKESNTRKESLESNLADIKIKLDDAHKEIQAKDTELHELKIKVNEYSNSSDVSANELVELRVKIAEQSKTIEENKSNLAHMLSTMNENALQLEESKEKLSLLVSKLSSKEGEIVELKKRLKIGEERYKEAQSEIEESTDELMDKLSLIEEQEKTIERLKQQLEEVNTGGLLKEALDSKKLLENSNKVLGEELKQLKNDYNVSQRDLQRAKDDCDHLQSELYNTKEKMKLVQEELDTAKMDLNQARKDIDRMNEELKQVHANLSQLSECEGKLREELNRANEEINSSRILALDVQQLKEALNKAYMDLGRVVDGGGDAKQQALNTSVSYREDFEEELKVAKEILDTSETNVLALKRQVEESMSEDREGYAFNPSDLRKQLEAAMNESNEASVDMSFREELEAIVNRESETPNAFSLKEELEALVDKERKVSKSESCREDDENGLIEEFKKIEIELREEQTLSKELKKKLEVTETTLKELREQCVRSENELKHFNNDRQKSENQLEQLKIEYENCASELRQTKEEHEKSKSELMKIIVECDESVNELIQLKKEHERCVNELTKLKEDYEESINVLDQTRKEQDRTENELKELKTKLDTSCNEKQLSESYQEDLRTKNSLLEEAGKKCVKLEEELRESRKAHEATESNLKELLGDMEQLKEELNLTRKANIQIVDGNEIETLRKLVQEREEEISNLKNLLERSKVESKEDCDKFTTQNKQLKEEYERSVIELKQLKEEYERSENELKQFKGEYVKSEDELKQLKEVYERSENELKQLKEENKLSVDEFKQLSIKYEISVNELEQTKEEQSRAEAALLELKTKYDSSCKDFGKHLDDLQEELQMKNQLLEETDKKLVQLSEESGNKLRLLDEELSLSRKAHQASEDNVKELDANVKQLKEELNLARKARMENLEDKFTREISELNQSHENKVEDLRKLLREKEEQLNNLQNILRDSEVGIVEMKNNLEDNQTVIRDIGNNLKEKEKIVSEQKMLIQAKEQILDDLKKQLQDKEKIISELKIENLKTNDASQSQLLENKISELAKVPQEKLRLEKNISDLQEELKKRSELQVQKDELVKETLRLQEELQKFTQEKNELVKENLRLQEELQKFTQEKHELVKEELKLQEKVQKFTQENNELVKETSRLQEELQRFTQEKHDLVKENLRLQEVLQKFAQEKQALQKQAIRFQSEIEKATKQNGELENNFSVLSLQLKHQNNVLGNKLSRLEKEYGTLQQQNLIFEEKNSQLEQKSLCLQEANERARRVLEEKAKVISDLEHALEEKKKDVLALKDDLQVKEVALKNQIQENRMVQFELEKNKAVDSQKRDNMLELKKAHQERNNLMEENQKSLLELKKVYQERSNLVEENNRALLELKKINDERNSLAEENHKALSELKKIYQERSNLIEENQKVLFELKKVRDDKAGLQKMLNGKEELLNVTRRKQEELAGMLEATRQTLGEKLKALDAARELIQEKEGVIFKLKNQVSNKEADPTAMVELQKSFQQQQTVERENFKTLLMEQEKMVKECRSIVSDYEMLLTNIIVGKYKVNNLELESNPKSKFEQLKTQIIQLVIPDSATGQQPHSGDAESSSEDLHWSEEEGLTEKLFDCYDRLRKLDSANYNLRMELSEKNQELRKYVEEKLKKGHSEDIEVVDTGNENLKDIVEIKKIEITELKLKIDELKSENEQLDSEVLACLDKIKDCEVIIDARDATIDNLEKKLKENSGHVDNGDIMKELDKSKLEVKELEARVEKFIEVNKDLEVKFGACLHKINMQKETIKTLKDQIAQKESLLQAKFGKNCLNCAQLKLKMNNMQQRIDQYSLETQSQQSCQIPSSQNQCLNCKLLKDKNKQLEDNFEKVRQELDKVEKLRKNEETRECYETINNEVERTIQRVQDTLGLIRLSELSGCGVCSSFHGFLGQFYNSTANLNVDLSNLENKFLRDEERLVNLLEWLFKDDLMPGNMDISKQLHNELIKRQTDLKRYKKLDNVRKVFLTEVLEKINKSERNLQQFYARFKSVNENSDCKSCLKSKQFCVLIMKVKERISSTIDMLEMSSCPMLNCIQHSKLLFDTQDQNILPLQKALSPFPEQKDANNDSKSVELENLQIKYKALKHLAVMRHEKLKVITELIEKEGYNVVNLDHKPIDIKISRKLAPPRRADRKENCLDDCFNMEKARCVSDGNVLEILSNSSTKTSNMNSSSGSQMTKNMKMTRTDREISASKTPLQIVTANACQQVRSHRPAYQLSDTTENSLPR